MKKILFTFVVFVGLVFVARSFLFKRDEIKLSKYSSYLSCQGSPFDLKVKFQSEAYLVNKGLPSSAQELNGLYHGVVYYQNLFTFMNLAKINNNGLIKSIGLGNRPIIKILKIEPASYPSSAEFEGAEEISGFPSEQEAYLKKVIATSKVLKGEPATKVSYEYENDLFVCANSEQIQDMKKLKFVQPIDPYFSYFVVPVSQRRSIQNPIWKVKATVNPCLSPTAVAAIGVAKFAFWYHWLPELQGRDSDGDSLTAVSFTPKENLSKLCLWTSLKIHPARLHFLVSKS